MVRNAENQVQVNKLQADNDFCETARISRVRKLPNGGCKNNVLEII